MTVPIPVFDGHNDVLLRLYRSSSPDPVADFLAGEDAGHIDLKKAKAGSLAGGLFAMYSPAAKNADGFFDAMSGGAYAVPLPEPLTLEEARRSVEGELAILLRLARASQGAVAICTTTADIRAAMARGALAVVLHLEGAEAIDADFRFLEILMRPACVRSDRCGAELTFLAMACRSIFRPALIWAMVSLRPESD